MKKQTRRDFIKHIGLACGAAALPSYVSPFSSRLAFAASCTSGPSSSKVIVSIFLNGGPDGKSILVPRASQAYLAKNPNLGITNSLVLDAAHGLHPSMVKTKALFDQQKVAMLMGAGYPQHSRSHEDSTYIMGAGLTNFSGTPSGYGGRAAQAYCNSNEAYSMFSFRGSVVDVKGAPFTAPTGQQLSSFSYSSTGDTANDTFINQITRANRNTSGIDTTHVDSMYNAWSSGDGAVGVMKSVVAAYPTSTAIVYPNTDIGKKLADAAKLINATSQTPVRQIFLSQGGYDTHENQAPVLSARLGELDSALDVFYSDMTRLGRADDVVIIAFGEFGRTNENGTLGCDHGNGGICMVMGNPVAGGVRSPAYTDSDFTGTNPWVPDKFDYREALEQIYTKHLGFDASAIFPQFNRIGLSIIR